MMDWAYQLSGVSRALGLPAPKPDPTCETCLGTGTVEGTAANGEWTQDVEYECDCVTGNRA